MLLYDKNAFLSRHETIEKKTLTALFLRVALFDVLACFRGVHLAAVRTAKVLQMSTEGL